jgi:DUF177 domain-containing protein
VSYSNQFIIPFKGLALGEHNFEFEIDKKFFEEFNYSELENGKVSVSLLLLKEESMITLSFQLQGNVEVICDRCGDSFQHKVENEDRVFIKFGHKEIEESEEISVLPKDSYEINIGQYIYEFISLALPYRKVHPKDKDGKDQCNQEVIKKLQNQSKENAIDPRWDALRKLKK